MTGRGSTTLSKGRSGGERLVGSESKNKGDKGKGCRGEFPQSQSHPRLFIRKTPDEDLPSCCGQSDRNPANVFGGQFSGRLVASIVHARPTYARIILLHS